MNAQPAVAIDLEDRTVMAEDGMMYVFPIGERMLLDMVALADDGLHAWLSLDGELVAELAPIGSA